MAKSIMIQGTMSNAGKSILAGGLCRVFHQDGYRVAPFKSQNMALNSFITGAGLEMGRAQVMQAEAAGIEPTVAMNPILLKPTNDVGSQVIVNGEVVGTMSAAEYYRRKPEFIPVIMAAYEKLSAVNDIIVIEGAGSPAEINLREHDIVNMGLARMVDAPVLLVGDIDRGGVFAQIVGTIELLEAEDRQRIKGTIINKFRGDQSILAPGLTMLEQKTGILVKGVIPYFHLDIDDEDSLTERFDKKNGTGLIDIAVIRVPRISNFTDFAPLECIPEVNLRYVAKAGDFGDPDAVLLPGTKNTIADLLWLRQCGLEAQILKHSARGKLVFGICGGYQLLGRKIHDPMGTEQQGSINGLGLLPIETTFVPEKTRTRVRGRFLQIEGLLSGLSGIEVEGYEIHLGISKGGQGDLLSVTDTVTGFKAKADGTWCENVYGCYIHGIFDKAEVTKGLVQSLMRQKGYVTQSVQGIDMKAYKEEQYDQLAKIIRENLALEDIYKIIEQGTGSALEYMQKE